MLERWTPAGEAQLHYDVQKVLSRYARGVDRKDWALVLSAFHEDAQDDHGSTNGPPAKFVEAFALRQEVVAQCFHLNGQTLLLEIDYEGRAVLAETYCIGWQRLSPDASTVPPEFVNDLLSGEPGASRLRVTANRYVDLLTEREGELRILRRTVVYEWTHLEASDRQLLLQGRTMAQRSRSDTSYTSLHDYAMNKLS